LGRAPSAQLEHGACPCFGGGSGCPHGCDAYVLLPSQLWCRSARVHAHGVAGCLHSCDAHLLVGMHLWGGFHCPDRGGSGCLIDVAIIGYYWLLLAIIGFYCPDSGGSGCLIDVAALGSEWPPYGVWVLRAVDGSGCAGALPIPLSHPLSHTLFHNTLQPLQGPRRGASRWRGTRCALACCRSQRQAVSTSGRATTQRTGVRSPRTLRSVCQGMHRMRTRACALSTQGHTGCE